MIRSRSGIVVYVGESHTGRLYGTLTRHFQSWSGLTAGTTYSLLGGYEAAVIVTKTPRAAVRLQEALIRRLEPRDNTHHAGGDDAEDVDLGSAEDDFAEGPDPFDF